MEHKKILTLDALMVSNANQKETKGTLDLFTNKCIVKLKNGEQYNFSFDIIESEISSGSYEVKKLFGVKKVFYIQISYQGQTSEKIILGEEDISAVKNRFANSKDDCIRIIAEEKRIAEEQRLLHEKMERERKAREERERLERERLEQERLERERLERERLEKERIEREKAEKEKRDNWASYKITAENKKALASFLDNPYRILGLSCLATKEDANLVLDRVKKLARISKNSNIKMKFFLQGFRPLNADLSVFQKAISEVSQVGAKFFWFEEESYCSTWNQINNASKDEVNLKYDDFLAVYLSTILLDPLFKDDKKWTDVFDCIAHLSNAKNVSKLKKHLGIAAEGLTNLEIQELFKEEIMKPIHILADDTEIESFLALYNLISSRKNKIYLDVRDEIGSEISQWLERRTTTLVDTIEECEKEKYTKAAIKKLTETADAYLKDTGRWLDKIKKVLAKETVRLEMLLEAYKNALMKVVLCLLEGKEKKKAVKYVNEVYPISDYDFKRKLRNVFGVENIKNAEDDVTPSEAYSIGFSYHHGEDDYKVDYKKAHKWYMKAYDYGNSDAANGLGILYQNGYGVDQNEYTAFRYYRFAADAGHPYGLYNLAFMYIEGEGCVKDRNKGLELLREAHAKGHPSALEASKKVLEVMLEELARAAKSLEHSHYDLEWQFPSFGKTLIVEVTLNYSANVYLMEDDEYDNYKNHERFSYYGGRATSSPYRVKIPSDGHWHLVIDNDENGMDGIESEVHIRTINNYY